MDTQLQTGRVRLSITGTDRRVAAAVVNRFLDWWDATGRRDLVMPSDIEPRADVSWSSNTASITLPVHFTASTVRAEERDASAPPQSSGSFVEFHALAHRSSAVGGGRDWTFEVVDDLPDTDLLFPSEVASRRALDRLRRWRRHRGPVTRLTRRVAGGAKAGAAHVRHVVTWPSRAARGLRFIAGPRPLVRAAAVSVVLALAITAAIARPIRLGRITAHSRAAAAARLSPPAPTTIERTSPPAGGAIANTPVRSRSVASFAMLPRVSPSRAGTAYLRATRVTIRKNELALRAAQRKNELALLAEQKKDERQLLAAQRKTEAAARTTAKPLVASASPSKPTRATKAAPSDAVPTPTTGTEYTGALLVSSEPSGAAVKIDGQPAGTTPLQIDRIRAGSHAIQVSLDGYPVWSTAATVVYGKSNGVVARFTR